MEGEIVNRPWCRLLDVMNRVVLFLQRRGDLNTTGYSLLFVLGTRRHVVYDRIRTLNPRILRESDFGSCVQTLSNFRCLEKLVLPPLTSRVVSFELLALFRSLRTLELHLSLSGEASSLAPLALLESLVVSDSKVNFAFLESISSLRRLCSIKMVEIDIIEQEAFNVFNALPENVRSVEIDESPLLTQGPIHSLLDLPLLEVLKLGLYDLNAETIGIFSQLQSEIHLTVYGNHDLNAFEALRTNLRITELGFIGFSNETFPNFLLDMARLVSLTLKNKKGVRIAVRQIKRMPHSLRSLNLNLGLWEEKIMKRIKHLANRRLTSLTLNFPYFEGFLGYAPLKRLRSLTISAKELDGDALRDVRFFINLEKLHIAGCLNLDRNHIRELSVLEFLEVLTLSSCGISAEGVSEIASLRTLRSLSFYFCPSIAPQQIQEMPQLKVLKFGLCPRIEGDLDALLRKPFVRDLDFIGFRFLRDGFPAPLKEFCSKPLRVCVNPNISWPSQL